MSNLATRLPAPLHRVALRVAHRLRKLWWRVARPHLHGVSLIALDDTGRVLLVRHSYQKRGEWCLPSGGVACGRPVLEVAAEELHEETGLIAGASRVAGQDRYQLHGADNRVTVIEIAAHGRLRPDNREIEEARFFALDDLPRPLNPAVLRTLEIWRAG
jgi:ADP-ribose pyrophosphatase YjhB (NUDIX family)